MISEDIGASLSEDKAVLLVFNKSLGEDLQDVLGPGLTGPIVQVAANLGVDDSAGLPQRHRGKHAKAKQRTISAAARARRVGKIVKTGKHDKPKLAGSSALLLLDVQNATDRSVRFSSFVRQSSVSWYHRVHALSTLA